MVYRKEIDGLRAWAIILVVIFHAFPKALPGGFIGVDVFFVISGYLITHILADEIKENRFSFTDFYARRFRRLLPAFLVVIFFFYLLAWKALLPDEFANLGKNILATAGFSENILLWKESGYFDLAAETKPLLHFWSLGVEEQFYLVWPTLLLIAYKRKWSVLYYSLLLYAISLYLSITQVHFDLSGTFYGLSTRFWELLTGALVYFSESRKSAFVPNRLGVELLTALSLSVLLVSSFILDSSFLYPSYWALLPTLATAAIVAVGRNSFVARFILGNPVSIGIGLISYPLYLWHWPFLSILRIVENSVLTSKLIWESIGLSFCLAYLTWRFVEKPIQRKIQFRKNPGVAGKVVFVSLLLLALVAVGGLVTWKAEGFPARFQNGDRPFEPYSDLRPWLDKHEGKSSCAQIKCEKPSCICENPEPEKAKVAIWGDSHAWAIGYGFETLNIPTLLFVQPTCLPLVGLRSRFGPEHDDQCFHSNASVAAYLNEQKNIKTVVMVSMDTPYLTSIRNGKPITLALEGIEPSTNDAAALFYNGYRNTLQTLVSAGKKVIVYMDHPEFVHELDPHVCTSFRPLRFSTIEKPGCDWPREQFENQRARVNAIYAKLAEEFPMVTFYRSADVLCDRATCHGVIGSRRMFSDGDHLSAAGGILMAHALEKYLPP